MIQGLKYDGYTITYNPKPFPQTKGNFDWDFAHDDYDGAPDAGDMRCGYGSSPQDCIQQIKEITAGLYRRS